MREKNRTRSGDVINFPTGIIDNVSVKPYPKSVSNFLFSACRMFGTGTWTIFTRDATVESTACLLTCARSLPALARARLASRACQLIPQGWRDEFSVFEIHSNHSRLDYARFFFQLTFSIQLESRDFRFCKSFSKITSSTVLSGSTIFTDEGFGGSVESSGGSPSDEFFDGIAAREFARILWERGATQSDLESSDLATWRLLVGPCLPYPAVRFVVTHS
jgi:hypothetical protein